MITRTLLLGTMILLLAPVTANAVYRDTGYDPNDMGSIDGYRLPDIRSTTLRVARVDERRILAVIVRSYGRWRGFHIHVRLDVRGGHRVDALMMLTSAADEACIVWLRGHRGDAVRGRFGLRGDRTVCRVPMRMLRPDKRVRWKVTAQAPDGGFDIDYAPDNRGWYA